MSVHPLERSTMMEIPVLFSRVATNHVCLLSTWNTASTIEKLNFKFYLNLNDHVWLVATISDSAVYHARPLQTFDWLRTPEVLIKIQIHAAPLEWGLAIFISKQTLVILMWVDVKKINTTVYLSFTTDTEHFTPGTSGHQMLCGGFPAPGSSVWYQPGVPWFNSVLMLRTQG